MKITEQVHQIRIDFQVTEINGVFLTHAHPDHMCSAAAIRQMTDCRIYSSEVESRWIEDIDLQFQERTIPAEEDLPIIINLEKSIITLNRIAVSNGEIFCPAWDRVYDKNAIAARVSGIVISIE